MEKTKTIYDLELHEVENLGKHIDIIRVPGGWIYTEIYEYSDGMAMSKCFVPFDNEFMEKN